MRIDNISIEIYLNGTAYAQCVHSNGNKSSVVSDINSVSQVVSNWLKVAKEQRPMTDDEKKRREEDERKNREDEDRRRREQELMNVNTAIVTTLLTGE